MKKQLLTAAICATSLITFGQTKPDTTLLNQEIQTLSASANIIAKRNDVSVAQELPILTLINQIIQADLGILEAERKRRKK